MPSTDTTHRPSTPCEPVRGPLELRKALEEFATPETLDLFDRQVDGAVKTAIEDGDTEPLETVLAHWLFCVRVARREIRPERSADPMGDTIKAWEAAHPGEKLFDAA